MSTLPRRLRTVWYGLLIAAAGGCVGPRAELIQPRCERVSTPEELSALTFRSTVQTHSLSGQQVVLRVALIGKHGQPIASHNGRFQDATGNVGASRTLMVLKPAWTFHDVQVTIPAKELEVTADDLPASALVGVYRPDGTCLARSAVRLPLRAPDDLVAMGSLPPPGVGSTPPDREQRTPADRGAEGPALAGPPADRPPGSVLARRDEETEAVTQMPAPPEQSAADTEGQPGRPPATPNAATPPTPAPAEAGKRTVNETPPPTARPQPVPETPAPQEPPAAAQGVRPRSPTAAAPDPSRPRTHKIQEGDSLRSIAQEYYGSARYWDTILAANPAVNPRRLRIGQTILLPPLKTPAARSKAGYRPGPRVPVPHQQTTSSETRLYVVRAGDTLAGIAHRELGDAFRWREIYKLNQEQLSAPNRLRIGMRLRIPLHTSTRDGPARRSRSYR